MDYCRFHYFIGCQELAEVWLECPGCCDSCHEDQEFIEDEPDEIPDLFVRVCCFVWNHLKALSRDEVLTLYHKAREIRIKQEMEDES